MKARLHQAVALKQEALADQKAAAAATAAGAREQAADFQIAAILRSDAAQSLLQLLEPPVLNAGEVIPDEDQLPDSQGGWALRDTLRTPDTPAVAASLARTELLTQSNLDVLALGLDAAATANCNDSLTKALCHQAALAHAAVFKVMEQAAQQAAPAEMARLINTATRLMGAYQQALLVLHRLQHGGKQTMTVQHINVTGGQTLVAGHMETRGPALPPGEQQ